MKIAIITGASKGLGLAMTKTFLDENYFVIALDIDENTFTSKINNKNYYYIKCDISNADEIKKTFRSIKEKFNSAHILINNAGIATFEKNILDVELEDCTKVLNTNLLGSFLCAKEFISLNKGQKYGRIINIASTRWHQNMADWELYGMSKGGLVSFTNTLCVSLIGTPITVNAISPGFIDTGKYELEPRDHEIHPSNRVGKPDDIARTCLFLADERNDFINGANIVVDGGMTKKMIY